MEKKRREMMLLENAEFCQIFLFFKLGWVSGREFSQILSIAK